MEKAEIIQEIRDYFNSTPFEPSVLQNPHNLETLLFAFVQGYLKNNPEKAWGQDNLNPQARELIIDVVDGVISGFQQSNLQQQHDLLHKKRVHPLFRNLSRRISDSIDATSINADAITRDSSQKANSLPYSPHSDILVNAYEIVEKFASITHHPSSFKHLESDIRWLREKEKQIREHLPQNQELPGLIELCQKILMKRIRREGKCEIPYTEKWLCDNEADRIVFAQIVKRWLTLPTPERRQRPLGKLKLQSHHPVNRTLIEILLLKQSDEVWKTLKNPKEAFKEKFFEDLSIRGPLKAFVRQFIKDQFMPALEALPSHAKVKPQDIFIDEIIRYIDEGHLPEGRPRILPVEQKIESTKEKKKLILQRLYKGGLDEELIQYVVRNFIQENPLAPTPLNQDQIQSLRRVRIETAQEAKDFLIRVRQEHKELLQGTLLWEEMRRFMASYNEPLLEEATLYIRIARRNAQADEQPYIGPSLRQISKLIKSGQDKEAKELLSFVGQGVFEQGKELTDRVANVFKKLRAGKKYGFIHIPEGFSIRYAQKALNQLVKEDQPSEDQARLLPLLESSIQGLREEFFDQKYFKSPLPFGFDHKFKPVDLSKSEPFLEFQRLLKEICPSSVVKKPAASSQFQAGQIKKHKE